LHSEAPALELEPLQAPEGLAGGVGVRKGDHDGLLLQPAASEEVGHGAEALRGPRDGRQQGEGGLMHGKQGTAAGEGGGGKAEGGGGRGEGGGGRGEGGRRRREGGRGRGKAEGEVEGGRGEGGGGGGRGEGIGYHIACKAATPQFERLHKERVAYLKERQQVTLLHVSADVGNDHSAASSAKVNAIARSAGATQLAAYSRRH